MLPDRAEAAHERGDLAAAARLFAEQHWLVEGPYWRAGEQVRDLAPADEEECARDVG